MHFLPSFATHSSRKYQTLKNIVLGASVTIGVVAAATTARAAIDQANKELPIEPPASQSSVPKPTKP